MRRRGRGDRRVSDLGATIADVIGAASDTPDRTDVPCRYCGAETMVVGACVDMLKSWNRQEAALAEKHDRRAEMISLRQVAVCDACLPRARWEKAQQTIEESTLAALYLRQVRDGTGDADVLVVGWLLDHGYRRQLDIARALARATTDKAAERAARAATSKAKRGAHVPPPTEADR